MRLLIVIFLALALQSAPAPFSATWRGAGVARLAWTQPAGVVQTCLIRRPIRDYPRLVGCWYGVPEGAQGLTLGSAGPIDGNFRPTAGDVYELELDGAVVSTAALRGVVYLGVMRR